MSQSIPEDKDGSSNYQCPTSPGIDCHAILHKGNGCQWGSRKGKLRIFVIEC